MKNWFTTDKIDSNSYIISEYRHWEETHCYLLSGTKRSLLIDTGLGVCDIADEVNKLTSLPVTAVATHIHWDHIGGHACYPDFYAHEAELNWLDGEFPLSIETVREMVLDRCEAPEDFRIENYTMFQGRPTRVLRDGDTIDLGGGAVLSYLAPLEEYDDMNNNSLVGRLVYGKRAFLFTGDAERKSENAILESGVELSADVYSIPHHGSNTGMSQKFLDAVDPEFATISVGEGNDYGHPHQDTLERLHKAGVPCLRTDLLGNIVIETEGESLVIVTDQGQVMKSADGGFDLVQPER